MKAVRLPAIRFSKLLLMCALTCGAIPFESASWGQVAASSVVQIENQAEPGSGFFVLIGGRIVFITAKHVVGSSGESISFTLSNGNTLQIPLDKQLPLNGIDAAVVLIENNTGITPLPLSSDNPSQNDELTVWGYPITSSSTKVSLAQRKGAYLGSPPSPQDGYTILYGAKTQVGFSGGPILNSQGQVVGMHGRSESKASSSGESVRTGNALGIPISRILASFTANAKDKSSSISIEALQDQAAKASMQKVYEILSKPSFSDQAIAELQRASQGKIPAYCIEMATAYYYTFFSSLPDLAKANASMKITKKYDNVDAAYYGLGSLLGRKSADYNRKLQFDRILEQIGKPDYIQYSERRLQDEVQSAISKCAAN